MITRGPVSTLFHHFRKLYFFTLIFNLTTNFLISVLYPDAAAYVMTIANQSLRPPIGYLAERRMVQQALQAQHSIAQERNQFIASLRDNAQQFSFLG
jgi:hypothetical protein